MFEGIYVCTCYLIQLRIWMSLMSLRWMPNSLSHNGEVKAFFLEVMNDASQRESSAHARTDSTLAASLQS